MLEITLHVVANMKMKQLFHELSLILLPLKPDLSRHKVLYADCGDAKLAQTEPICKTENVIKCEAIIFHVFDFPFYA